MKVFKDVSEWEVYMTQSVKQFVTGFVKIVAAIGLGITSLCINAFKEVLIFLLFIVLMTFVFSWADERSERKYTEMQRDSLQMIVDDLR